MIRSLLVFFCVYLSVSGFAEDEHLSVTEESLPRLPSFPQEERSQIVIKKLQGIVLLRSNEAMEGKFENAQGIEIIDIKIPGNSKKLERNLSHFLGNEVTTDTLFEIKTTISDYYTSSNHPLVIVDIPDQDVTSGVLQIVILESRLGKVEVEGNRWSSEKRLKEYVKLRPNQEIDENRLIQNISFMNRNPFRRVDIIYSPGEEPATTDVILAVKDRRPVRVYAGTENTGVEPTGRGRWYTGVNWGNAFGLDHIFSYQFTSAFNVHRFHAHTTEYTALLSWGHVANIW